MTNKVKAYSRFSEEDIYLFKEGKHYRLYQHLGSHPVEHEGEQGVYFAVFAPGARAVQVIGDFNHWNGYEHNLNVRWDASGIWEGFIPEAKVGQAYKYRIYSHHSEQQLEKADPFARRAEHPPKTASIIYDGNFEWKDKKWMNERIHKQNHSSAISVYELHLGSWRRTEQNDPLSYRDIARELIPYIKDLGFTHVEFMPVMEHPYDPSWGYQITGYFAPTSRFGTPEDFQFLVDELHKNDIGVILDWVPSHFPEDEHGLGLFDGSHVYEHPDRRKGYHPDWKSLIFNYGRPEVRSFLISNALFWLDKFHIDALRVDAVASMLYLDYSREYGQWEPNDFGGNEYLEAIAFLKDFNMAVYQNYPGTQTIAEESTSFHMVSRPVHDGGLGFGMKWMMGWMNDSLRYFARSPIHRKHHHGEVSFSLVYAFSENFMLPLSHDEVVYGKKSLLEKMPGDDWQKFANLRLLFSWMFLHPGSKLVFMGGEFGQRSEWNFKHSLQWHELEYESHQGVYRMMKALNQLYRSEKALYELSYVQEGFQWIEHDDSENSVFSFIRKGESESDQLICILNFTPVPRDHYEIGVPDKGSYELLYNSDESKYWGSAYHAQSSVESTAAPRHGFEHTLNLKLPPLAALVYKRSKD